MIIADITQKLSDIVSINNLIAIMAKKKQNTVPARKIQKKTILIVVIVAALSLAGYLGVRYLQTEVAYKHDKARFTATEKDMNTAYDAVVGKFGVPIDKKVNRGCSYSFIKFSNKSLSCSTSVRFSYATANLNKSKTLGKSVLMLVDKNSNMDRWDFGYDTSDATNQTGGAYRALYKSSEQLSCSLSHQVYLPAMYYSRFGGSPSAEAHSNFISAFTISCAKITAKALYSVER
jgi:hypothetical protein